MASACWILGVWHAGEVGDGKARTLSPRTFWRRACRDTFGGRRRGLLRVDGLRNVFFCLDILEAEKTESTWPQVLQALWLTIFDQGGTKRK